MTAVKNNRKPSRLVDNQGVFYQGWSQGKTEEYDLDGLTVRAFWFKTATPGLWTVLCQDTTTGDTWSRTGAWGTLMDRTNDLLADIEAGTV